MKNICILLSVILFRSTTPAPTIDKVEEKKAFELLNKIRVNPAAYHSAYHFSLTEIKARPKLKWNETLAKVAEQKALDMAKRNYFEHVDPDGYGMNYYMNKGGYTLDPDLLTDKKANYFESIEAGSATGELAIKDLIIDAGVPSLGHRYHLLGVGEWNESLVDIGIGFVRSTGKTDYITYVSVLIATHEP